MKNEINLVYEKRKEKKLKLNFKNSDMVMEYFLINQY